MKIPENVMISVVRKSRLGSHAARSTAQGVAASIFLMSMLSTCAQAQHQSGQSQLVIDETFAIKLDQSFIPSAAAIGSSGIVGLINSDRDYIVIASPSRVKMIGMSHIDHPIGAAFIDDHTIEVYEGRPSRIVRLDLLGHVISARRCEVPLQVADAATYSGRAWYVGGHNLHGDYIVYRVEGRSIRKLVQRNAAIARGLIPSASLAPLSDGAIVSWFLSPFDATGVSAAGRELYAFHPLLDQRHDSLSSILSRGRWIGLKTVELDSGFMQTLADLKSDHRVLLRFDRLAHLVKFEVIDAPIGFMASNVQLRALVGVRDIGKGKELVFYHWRWVAHKPS